jgi:XTP/dITP diphosphohydrolase
MSHRLLVATSNPHKLEELTAIFREAEVDVELLTLADVPAARDLDEPVEDAETFLGNASIKASAYARAAGLATLADDSGLVVDALNGAPGVRSARYAGVGDSRAERDAANNERLLAALAEVPDGERAARFVCVIAVASPDGEIVAHAEGVFEGVIGREARGTRGFGYDPLLVLPEGLTSAELRPEEKNRRSHRSEAARALAPRLGEILARR